MTAGPRTGTVPPVERPVRVLVSFSGIKPTTNPYITQLAGALESQPGVEVILFSWRRALLGRYDVFHVHWPEQLMGGHKGSGRAVRRMLTALFCLRMWCTRVPVVRTWHNVERPTDAGFIEHWLLDAIDRLTKMRIRLNPVSAMPPDSPYVTILHGHYRDWYAGCRRQHPVPGRIACVGQVRRYKGIEELIISFRACDDPGLTLTVAGKPTSTELAESVTALARGDERITLQLFFLDDAEFVEAITSAELVVLPYRFMHNSGAVLAALSLDRPVLVPDTEVNRLLADEVGEAWIYVFRGPLDPNTLSGAYKQSHLDERAGAPDLRDRGWDRAAADHERAYRAVARATSPHQVRGSLRREAPPDPRVR